MVDYIIEFDQELEEIEKLIQTPELIRSYSLEVLESVFKKGIPYTYKTSISNGILALKNISDRSIRDNYEAIYNQCCVLAVSLLGAKIEKYFINYGNYNWDKIDTSKKGKEIKFSLSELAEHEYNLKPSIMKLIKNKDSSISFQDLLSTKRTFDDFFKKNIELKDSSEKSIIFYQQCRHNIVHAGGRVDETFLSRLTPKKANIKKYELGEKIKLNDSDWKEIKLSFRQLIETLVKK